MSAFQLPDSVTGSAVACLVYSVLCLFLNCVLVWLIFTHHERTSCEWPLLLFLLIFDFIYALHRVLIPIYASSPVHRCGLHCLLHFAGDRVESGAAAVRLHPVAGYYDMAVHVQPGACS